MRTVPLAATMTVLAVACSATDDPKLADSSRVSDSSIVAALPRFTLDATTSGTGFGRITLSPFAREYVARTLVTVSAAPEEGSVFTGWNAATPNGACLKAENPCTVDMDKGKDVVAIFSPAVGVGRFDGDYYGTFTTRGGISPPAAFKMTIKNGIVQGSLVAIFDPSSQAFSGTVSSLGELSATGGRARDGVCPPATIVYSGQLSTGFTSGIATAAANGSFSVADVPKDCGMSATFNVVRRTVPIQATGV